MTFNSYIFVLLFLPISLFGYFVLNHFHYYKISKCYLLAMSWWFYSYFNFHYFFIILLSILFNFFVSKVFEVDHIIGIKRKIIFIFALGLNLGVLFYFKYYNFFISNINNVFNSNFNLTHVILPLGISFFTFQQLSFVIDSYMKKVPKYSFLDYSLFVSFFPQLVAGPIVLHSEIVPQFANPTKKHFSYENAAKGITAFSFGLAKKVLIADTFGNVVNWGFENLAALDTTNAILVMLAYTIQIYFDFSGYCDMAIGIGLMFNIQIIQNFNSPYKSLTISEFWKRWHISLTRFFTNYIYIPLGGNRKGTIHTYINMFIVFLISGLWHGANWTFIFWGVLHGFAVIINRICKKKIEGLHPALNWLVTFGFINIAWIYFRAPTIKTANHIIKQILKLNFGPIQQAIKKAFLLPELQFAAEHIFHITSKYLPEMVLAFAFCGSLFLLLGAKNTNECIKSFKPNIIYGCCVVFLLTWCIVSFSGVSTFLYFNF